MSSRRRDSAASRSCSRTGCSWPETPPGFALNLGLTVRGMEFAVASGVMAARGGRRGPHQRATSRPTPLRLRKEAQGELRPPGHGDVPPFAGGPRKPPVLHCLPEVSVRAFRGALYDRGGAERRPSTDSAGSRRTLRAQLGGVQGFPCLEEDVMKIEEKLALDAIKNDKESHIKLDQEICGRCRERYCILVCPGHLYSVNEETGEVVVEYAGCLECGTCNIACVRRRRLLGIPEGRVRRPVPLRIDRRQFGAKSSRENSQAAQRHKGARQAPSRRGDGLCVAQGGHRKGRPSSGPEACGEYPFGPDEGQPDTREGGHEEAGAGRPRREAGEGRLRRQGPLRGGDRGDVRHTGGPRELRCGTCDGPHGQRRPSAGWRRRWQRTERR